MDVAHLVRSDSGNRDLMTLLGRVSRLERYPVKSMQGESLEVAELGSLGIHGDRCWAIRDETNGGIRGAKKFPTLMHLTARLPANSNEASPPAEVGFPDGSRAMTTDPDIHERLSDYLGHAVSLWPLVPAEQKDHYRRGAPTHEDMETELRATFARTPDEPLPNLGIFPPEIFEFESPPGTYFDAFPLLLLSEASLRSVQEKAPESQIETRRFRPNLFLTETAEGTPFPELDWRGQQIRIGEAILSITIECPRCVMVTHAQGDLPKDPQIMRTLVRESEGNLGVYARIEQPGRIRVGDAAELLE